MKHVHRHHHSKQPTEKQAPKEHLILHDQRDSKTKIAERTAEEEKPADVEKQAVQSVADIVTIPSPPSMPPKPEQPVRVQCTWEKKKNWLEKLKDKLHQLANHF